MLRSRPLPGLLRTAAVAIAAVWLGAPTVAQSPPVLGVDAAFVGVDDHGRGTYEVGLTLAPHADAQLVAHIADLASPPPYDPFPAEATWHYEGASSTVTRRAPSPA